MAWKEPCKPQMFPENLISTCDLHKIWVGNGGILDMAIGVTNPAVMAYFLRSCVRPGIYYTNTNFRFTFQGI